MIHIREREERRHAPTLAARRTDDAAQLTLLMAQAMSQPRPVDIAAAHAAYAAAQRDDEAILLSIAV